MRQPVNRTPNHQNQATAGDRAGPGEGRLTLDTIRSHDQFNTTIYSTDDRYRGLTGLRTVVLMNPATCATGVWTNCTSKSR